MKINKDELPSDKAKRQTEEKAALDARRKEAENAFKGAIGRLSATPDGMLFLRWLKAECGFGEAYLAVNPHNGELDEKRTLYQAMRLNLYMKVRKYLPLKQLIEVEHV